LDEEEGEEEGEEEDEEEAEGSKRIWPACVSYLYLST